MNHPGHQDGESLISKLEIKKYGAVQNGRRVYALAGLAMMIIVFYFIQSDYEYDLISSYMPKENIVINETSSISNNEPSSTLKPRVENNRSRVLVTTQSIRPFFTGNDFPFLTWYDVPANVSKDDRWTISVVSAFYDHRINKIVVLLASDVASLSHQLNNSFKYSFICQLFYANDDENSTESDGYFYTSYLFYCPLTNLSSDVPSRISLRRNDSSINVTAGWSIRVENLLQRKNYVKPKNLAVCVGILFGYQNWLILLQYIEFHRMMDVDKLIFFYSNLHPSALEILDWYKNRTNFVETVEWIPDHVYCGGDYKCQLLRDNYCSYALMYKYKYVGNSDFDELFFPLNGERSLVKLLDKVDRSDRGSFTFRARYHQLLKNDIPEWDDFTYENISYVVQHFLPLYHYNNVSTLAGHFYSPKTITKPETVLKRWVHYVERHVKGTGIYHFAENEAVLRHFKIRQWWGGWADQADKEVKYKMVDSYEEVGSKLLRDVIRRITDVTERMKLLSNETEQLKMV